MQLCRSREEITNTYTSPLVHMIKRSVAETATPRDASKASKDAQGIHVYMYDYYGIYITECTLRNTYYEIISRNICVHTCMLRNIYIYIHIYIYIYIYHRIYITEYIIQAIYIYIIYICVYLCILRDVYYGIYIYIYI